MKYVQNRKLVDISKLPGRDVISDLYHCDSQMSDRRISDICDAYERKIELYRNFSAWKKFKSDQVCICSAETGDRQSSDF